MREMRGRRYWYAAAALVLVGGVISAWLYPFSTSPGCASIALTYVCDKLGRHTGLGAFIAVGGLLSSLLLVAIGTLRDPPD